MKNNIDTIFFDVGNTLRYVVPDAAFSAQADQQLMELVKTTASHEEFFAELNANWKKYRKWAKDNLLDVSEMELWMQFLLPEYDPAIIAPNAPRLTRLWRDHDGRRVPHDDVDSTLRELTNRGYKLGIIANTITETEIPDWMCHDQVADCFKTVILSSKVRLRKPDPAIYLLGARCIDSKPEDCAYVGDNAVRDVDGAVDSGYGAMILFEFEGVAVDRDGVSPNHQPDYKIGHIGDLLDLFGPRG